MGQQGYKNHFPIQVGVRPRPRRCSFHLCCIYWRRSSPLLRRRCVLRCCQFSSCTRAMSRAHPSVGIPFETPRIDALLWTVFPTPPSPRMSLMRQQVELFSCYIMLHSFLFICSFLPLCGFNHIMKRHCYYIGLEANQNSILNNIGSRTNEMITWGEQLAGHPDHDRATFFLRSSENNYIGNVAAGSAGRG